MRTKNDATCSNFDCVYRHERIEWLGEKCSFYVLGFCKHGNKCRRKHVLKYSICLTIWRDSAPMGRIASLHTQSGSKGKVKHSRRINPKSRKMQIKQNANKDEANKEEMIPVLPSKENEAEKEKTATLFFCCIF